MPSDSSQAHVFAARAHYLRPRAGPSHHRVTNVELFFDLAFVFAVTQLSHGLLELLTPLGAAQIALLMLAGWWAWIDTPWITNWLDPERSAVRLLLFALMLAGLVLSASIPRHSGARHGLRNLVCSDSGWAKPVHALGGKKSRRRNFRNFVRIIVWHVAAAAL